MSLRRTIFPLLVITGISLIMHSCSIFTPAARTGTLEMAIESLDNGYLVHIRVNRPVGAVSALVTSAQWLLVTFADSLLEAESIREFRSSLIDTVEVTHFPTGLQLAFHLRVAVDTFDVIHSDPSPDVLISLFAQKKKGR